MAFFLFPMKEGERSLDIFKIAGRILVENDEAISALKETSKEAEEASESISDIDDEAKKSEKGTKQSSSGMVANFGKVAGAASGIVTAVIAIGKAIIEVAASTRDDRVEMAKLETAFYTAGHSAETATTTYQTLYSILGETDQAIEAANMLARLCDTEEQLAEMTNACIGIYATFGNSLPIEGLAEAANETAKVGTVTGQLADALNWLGISEDEFNIKLSRCNTERERAALITQTMVEAYGEAAQSYKESNEAITEAYLAQERLNQAMARFGEEAEPIATWFTNTWATAMNGFAIMLDEFADSHLNFEGKVYSQDTLDYWDLNVQKVQTATEAYAEYIRIKGIYDSMEPGETSASGIAAGMDMLAVAKQQWEELAEAERRAG